jgi:hypothetical protein
VKKSSRQGERLGSPEMLYTDESLPEMLGGGGVL